MARQRTRSASRARTEAGSTLLSRRPRTAAQTMGNTTAAATTGPARGPRPASSTPTRRCSSAQTARSQVSVGRGAIRSALALLPDSGGLAAQRAEVVQLRAAHPSPANQVDRCDGRTVNREEALDSHTRRDLPDRKGLADPATPLRDHQPLEGLKAFLVSLPDANHDPDGVSRIECRNVRAQALTGQFCQSFHGRSPSVRLVQENCNDLSTASRFCHLFSVLLPQIRPSFPGQPLRLLLPPGQYLGMIPGAEHLGNFEPPILRRSGIARRTQK